VTDYALALSEAELARYRMMAAGAASEEAGAWQAAGIVPGATVADVGCGPGAVLAELAAAVGPQGRVFGVDADPVALRHAREEVAPHLHVTVQVGAADASGLRPRSVDVAVCRHVLAHNGGREQAIVDHLASLVRPGGTVYLVDVDGRGARMVPDVPELDLWERYFEFHQGRGNDISVGLRLAHHLEAAGTTVERFTCISPMLRLPAGVRPPQWAAREAMVEAGVLTEADVERWRAAFEEIDGWEERPWLFVPMFVAVGRVPA
jgi:SAM-dependent methyltransferase